MSQEGQTTGNKRKRTALDTTQDVGVKLKSKLHHGVIEVRRAVKKVKGQELQKCVKRLKNVREKEPPPFDISQLDAELNYLKALDVELFGDTALYSKLKKDKVLSSNEHFIDVLASELSGSLVAPAKPGSPEAKVDARLLSSKALASEVSTVLTSLRSIINPPPRVQRPNEVEDPEQDGPAHPKKTAKVLTAFSTEDGIDEEEASGDVSDRLVPEEEDDEVDDGGWESGSVNSEDEGVSEDEDGVSRGNYDEERDDSDDEFPPPKKSKLAAAGSKVATRPIGGSTFLPSLSVGFTRGDSDSEPEDVDDDGPKKNRRGQRARRAIWEKKYGKNANHVITKQKAEPKGRTRPGFTPADRRQQGDGPPHRTQSGSNYAPSMPSQPHRSAPPARPYADDKSQALHPSWEAKRKMKEKLNPSIVPSQGKKIVF